MKRAVLALALATSCTAVAAHAAPAVDHYDVGKHLFELKRYAEALDEFRRALSEAPRPEVLYSLAQTQRLLGDCVGAVDTYRAFLASRPEDRLAEYARANIERCERGGPAPGRTDEPPWYHDTVGDVLVGGGLAAGVAGVVVWRSGRAAAMNLTAASDYQTFLHRRSAASWALTEQRIGVAAMIVGGAAIIGGVVHYVHHARSSHRDSVLGVALAAGGVVITGAGVF